MGYVGSQGESIHNPWDIPGTAHRPAPTPPRPTPMTVAGRTGEQAQVAAQQRQQPRGDTLSAQIYSGTVNVNKAFAEHRAASFDPNLTPEAQQAKLREFGQSEHAQALDVFELLADQIVAEKQAEVDRGKAVLRTALNPAAQTAAQRTWARDREVLGALATEGEKANAITEAIKSAASDPARLAVYAEEAPSYLKAAGVDPGFLDKVFAQVVPGQAERVNKRDLAIQERTALRQAVQMVRNGIQNGSPAVALDKIAPAISRLDPDAG